MVKPTALRVAILLPQLKLGGGEKVALSLGKALAALGCDVTFLLMSYEGEFLAEAEAEFRVIDLQCDRTYKLPGKLMRFASRNPVDLVISSYWKLNLCAALANVAKRYRLLLWEHSQPSLSSNSPTWLYGPTATILYRLATRVVCVSSGVRNDILGCTMGLASRLAVIFNPIPGTHASFAHPAAGARKQIVWVGRLDHPKNPELMVEALARLDDLDCDLMFIGDGKARARLEALAQHHDLCQRVAFAGFVADPYPLMLRANLLVLTSDREGFGNVLVEGLHAGLGIVSTDCGMGVHEILEEGAFGSIVPMHDPSALADAIRGELATPRDPNVQRARAQFFEPGNIARQFIAAAGLEPPDRSADHFGDGALRHDPPSVEAVDAVAAGNRRQAVRDEDHGQV